MLGASGAVGHELLQLLEQRSFPVRELRLLASERSAGTFQRWKGLNIEVLEVNSESFNDVDLVFVWLVL